MAFPDAFKNAKKKVGKGKKGAKPAPKKGAKPEPKGNPFAKAGMPEEEEE